MRPPLNHMKIRRESINHTFGMVRNAGQRPHQGWDLEAPVGTPVYAITSGTIKDVRDYGDYGKQVVLEFSNGEQTRYAFYAHLSSIIRMGGEAVQEGDLIGFTGKTGNASNLAADEDHLHFEIRDLPHAGKGLGGRIDPGRALGFEVYSCYETGVEPYGNFGSPAEVNQSRQPTPPWSSNP